MANCLSLLLLHENKKTQKVRMPNIRVRNNKLFASNACEFPQVYDSFPPSMLIKSVFV